MTFTSFEEKKAYFIFIISQGISRSCRPLENHYKNRILTAYFTKEKKKVSLYKISNFLDSQKLVFHGFKIFYILISILD